jgi:hypothetical protein
MIYVRYINKHEPFNAWIAEVTLDLNKEHDIYFNGEKLNSNIWIELFSESVAIEYSRLYNVDVLTQDEAFLEMI